MDFILNLFFETLSISMFVLIMMLIIEYINVISNGAFSAKLQNQKKSQILFGALLGAIPGCLGAYTVVSLYSHRIVSLGALTATMIATSGDEAFFLLSLDTKNAILIFFMLFILAIITGFIVDFFNKNHKLSKSHIIPQTQTIKYFHTDIKSYINQIKKISFQRAILIFGIITFIVLMLNGSVGHIHFADPLPGVDIEHLNHGDSCEHSHNHGFNFNWFNITLLVSSFVLLLIVLHVPDHFLEHHLWEHILKKHFLKILLWTLVALIIIKFVISNIHIESFINSHLWILLIISLLIGIIPSSGPHIIFITLFVSGTIPISILLANSIVQDGHASLPLFAESPKSFVFVKIVNIIVGALVGGAGLFFGF